MTQITATPIYELVSGDLSRSIIEAETFDALILKAQALRDEGEILANLVVLKGGEYDGAATALIQEGLI